MKSVYATSPSNYGLNKGYYAKIGCVKNVMLFSVFREEYVHIVEKSYIQPKPECLKADSIKISSLNKFIIKKRK